MKTRSILGLLPILFLCLAASSKPSTSTADAKQPTLTSTDPSTPTQPVPTLVAAPTPPAPPPQPPPFEALAIRNGTVVAVRLQAASHRKADRQEDDFDALSVQSGRANGQPIVSSGNSTATGNGACSALTAGFARRGKDAAWTGTYLAASRTGVGDRVAALSTARPAIACPNELGACLVPAGSGFTVLSWAC